ncbi:MAG: hypothetical protein JJU29_11900 [Verrucomicrobia bacterium]|nr:hypothetical protein [Verrucomicrobiota bacterium]MCH8514149.1 hypothetical protein [Kiritimatiellia bacterium]
MIIPNANNLACSCFILLISFTAVGCSKKIELDPNTTPSENRETPQDQVRQALREFDLDLLKSLIPSEVSVDAKIGTGGSPTGDTPLALALWEANRFLHRDPAATEIIQYLISCGADVNLPNEHGLTPLHFPHNLEVVRMFIDAGASVDIQATVDGTTPLYRTDNFEILQMLVPIAKDINAVDKHGMTALDYHMQWAYARENIIELLLANGAKTSANEE